MLRKIIIASAALLAASVLNARQALWGGGPVESPEMYSYIFNVDGLNVPDMNNIWVNRDIASMTSAASSGNTAFKLSFSADYSFSRLLTMSFYYDRQTNTPLLTSSSYPTTTRDFGLSLKFSLTR